MGERERERQMEKLHACMRNKEGQVGLYGCYNSIYKCGNENQLEWFFQIYVRGCRFIFPNFKCFSKYTQRNNNA